MASTVALSDDTAVIGAYTDNHENGNNSVEAQHGKKISDEEADDLVDNAQEIALAREGVAF